VKLIITEEGKPREILPGVAMTIQINATYNALDMIRPFNDIDDWFSSDCIATSYWEHCIHAGLFERDDHGILIQVVRFTQLGKRLWGAWLLHRIATEKQLS
jgi:hypothetical protein